MLLSSAPVTAADDLATILELALQSDPIYQQAESAALAVAEGVPQARAAAWLPVIRITGGASRVDQEVEVDAAFAFGQTGGTDFTRKNWNISATQPIYRYDRFVALKQASKSVQQANFQLQAAQQDLLVRVAERYLESLASQDNLEFARAEKESLKRQLEQAQQRFEVGLIAITDVQEAQAGYDRAVADEILAENALDNSFEALREVTGQYHSDLARLGESIQLKNPEPNDIEVWTATALKQNMRLAAEQIAAEIAHDEIRRQYAGHLPTIDLVGSTGVSDTGGRFGDSSTDESEIGVQFTMPIFEGFAVKSRTEEARYRHAESIQRVEQERRFAYRESREAFLGVNARISSVKALKQAVVSAQTAVDSTTAGFEVGTRTAVDVVASERGLFQAKRNYARSRYDYILEILRLKQAAGTLSPEDLMITNSWLEDGP
ncbi:MAG: TolC family outer membrane protein [Gammaproteobacteria bacterium]|nr:TolC family outer membrane protein [Gammaproteobacteria bacterium]